MTGRQIQAQVCALHSISLHDLVNGGNQANLVAARSEAMARCRWELGMSYPRIGRLFGRHHTTVIHAIGKYRQGQDRPTAPNIEHAMIRRARVVEAAHNPALEHALVRQARVIEWQGRMITEQAKQLEVLAAEVGELCAGGNGQQELFQEKLA
jgi:hypothetical protein